jgi:hypothetical protein
MKKAKAYRSFHLSFTFVSPVIDIQVQGESERTGPWGADGRGTRNVNLRLDDPHLQDITWHQKELFLSTS